MLGFTRSNFYYQPKSDPSEEVLRAEIEKLAAQYPTYGYRRITHLLVKAGYRVGYRRVARLMKSENLSVAVKRAAQTTHSTEGVRPWINHLKTLEVCRSVARRGCPWENGYAERLIRTLKEEEIHLNAYENIHEARERIGHFITHVYHHKRPHSALEYLTPLEFQRQNLS